MLLQVFEDLRDFALSLLRTHLPLPVFMLFLESLPGNAHEVTLNIFVYSLAQISCA